MRILIPHVKFGIYSNRFHNTLVKFVSYVNYELSSFFHFILSYYMGDDTCSNKCRKVTLFFYHSLFKNVVHLFLCFWFSVARCLNLCHIYCYYLKKVLRNIFCKSRNICWAGIQFLLLSCKVLIKVEWTLLWNVYNYILYCLFL